MKSQTLNIVCAAPVFNNKHAMQAFCDVINDKEYPACCNLMVKTESSVMRIGEVYNVFARTDLGENAYSMRVRLNNNFISNFTIIPDTAPEVEFKQTSTGVITHIVLLNWHNHFTKRNSKRV